MYVQNSVILITGASRGIGKAFAEEFLKQGAKKIYLGMLNPKNVNYFYGEKKFTPLKLDVTNLDQVRSAASKARDTTILINNAGVIHKGGLLDQNRIKNAQHEMAVNYFGSLAMIHAFSSILKSNGGGVIVNISSIAGLVAMPGAPTYSASKAAVHFLTMEARMELRSQGSTQVIGVYPGPVDTDMIRSPHLPKVTARHVARETINGIEAGRDYIFPDPDLKDIYAIFHDHQPLPIQKDNRKDRKPEARAA